MANDDEPAGLYTAHRPPVNEASDAALLIPLAITALLIICSFAFLLPAAFEFRSYFLLLLSSRSIVVGDSCWCPLIFFISSISVG
jgi:hypothetical protein